MSHTSHAASAPSEPRRALHTDFTARTMRHAAAAKRRADAKQHIRAFFKEPFSMKSLTFLRTAPGAMLAMAIVATTSVSAYALTNWFNANVAVKQSDSVLSVNLSQCKGNLPGIEPSADKHNVPFKILGTPHISAEQLQGQLLAECEFNAVADFYGNDPKSQSYSLYPSTVKKINADSTVTLDYFWGGQTVEKTFVLPKDTSVYDQGNKISLQDLQAGSMVVFAAETPRVAESNDPLATVSEVKSIFKTQYDTRKAPSATKTAFYEENNIMPLGVYNDLHR